MTLLSALLFNVTCAGNEVKFAPLIAGSVPVKFAAGNEVKFAPLLAGSVPVIFAAGKLVNFAPLPPYFASHVIL